MTRLKRLLHKNPITLIIELNGNDSESAILAEKAGADALLFEDISNASNISKVKIPVGVKIKGKDIKDVKRFDFADIHISCIDEMKNLDLTRVASLDENFSFEQLSRIEAKAEALDAAIIPISQGIKDLSVGDLQNYISIVMSAGIPVIIPTQRLIRPSEIAILADAGVKGVILNENVLGETPKSFEKAINEFRIAIDDLGA